MLIKKSELNGIRLLKFNMQLLAVNYHYIHNEDLYPYPGIYPISAVRFRNQLKELGKIFKFVGQEELIEAIDGRNKLPDKSCIITFDDGLACQYEKALPVLEDMKIPAIFFINGKPLAKNKALLVHKIHWLRANTEPKKFIEQISTFYQELTGEEFDVSKFNIPSIQNRKSYRYDTDNDARIKLILNKFLDTDLREKIIDKMFALLISDEKEFCNKFYMNSEQIRYLYKNKWLGIHSYSHPPLSLLPINKVKEEYTRCLEALKDIIGEQNIQIYGLSYPYGNPEYISHMVAQIAGEVGLKFGFTMERSFNTTLKEPLFLARADTHDVVGGRYPVFKTDNEGEIEITGDFELRRKLYIQE